MPSHPKKPPSQLGSFNCRRRPALIVVAHEVARAQAKHGIKGGRPRLDLTDDERAERRRKQDEAYRRRQGIPAKEARPPKAGPTNWAQEYCDIWGKLPGQPLTPEEFAQREPLWNAWIAERWGG